MATLLYLGKDPRVKEMAEQFFGEYYAQTSEINTIVQIKDSSKLGEAFIAMSFDLLLFEQSEMGGNLKDYFRAFQTKFPQVKTPLIVVGDEKDQLKIMSYLEVGFADYLVLPPDRPLLIEKILLFCTGKRDRNNKQVYSQILNQQADISKAGALEQLSEFDCQIKTPQNVQLNELVVIYSRAFSDNGNSAVSVLGPLL